MLSWDVTNGVARRAWARNDGALFAIHEAMEADPRLAVTLPEIAAPELVTDALRGAGLL